MCARLWQKLKQEAGRDDIPYPKHNPPAAEKKIKKRGGAKRWRTIKKGGKTLRCAVTREKGPRGGSTVCYKI